MKNLYLDKFLTNNEGIFPHQICMEALSFGSPCVSVYETNMKYMKISIQVRVNLTINSELVIGKIIDMLKKNHT